MDFHNIKKRITLYRQQNKEIFTTSSFQSHSLVLLHMLSRIDSSIPVVFLNTGFHFPETLVFRDLIKQEFGLKVIDLKPQVPKIMQKDVSGRLLFTSDPDHCCKLNKTMPLQDFMTDYDVWVNGIRADQSNERSEMKEEQTIAGNIIRFHPMLDWDFKMIQKYRKEYSIPTHPLEEKGYSSIGCEPCTLKANITLNDRDSRWFGLNKTECGLHTELT